MIVKTTFKLKRELMKKYAGALKGTNLYDNKIWKEVFKRKSRSIDWLDNIWPKEWLKN